MSFYGNTDFYTEVAKGNVPGHRIVEVSGLNRDIGTTEEDIWGPGGDIVYPTAGEQWEIVSNDANDTLLGTGANTIEISYLDDAYNEQAELVELNGGTVLMNATNAFRPLGGIVKSAGSLRENVGDIEFRVAGGGDPRGTIIAASNIIRQSHYTVPLGKTAYIIYAYSSIRKGKDSIILLKYTIGDNGVFSGKFPIEIYESFVGITPAAPVGPIPEKTDFKGIAVSLNPNTEITLVYQLLIVDN